MCISYLFTKIHIIHMYYVGTEVLLMSTNNVFMEKYETTVKP